MLVQREFFLRAAKSVIIIIILDALLLCAHLRDGSQLVDAVEEATAKMKKIRKREKIAVLPQPILQPKARNHGLHENV